MKYALPMVALASCVVAACRTASPPQLPADLLACGKLTDPDERVRCYDTRIAAMNRRQAATPAAAATAAPAAAAAPASVSAPAAAPAPLTAAGTARSSRSASSAPSVAPSQSLTAQFGAEQLPLAARPAAPPREEVLHSTITAVNEVRPNLYVISLANGQVWLQSGAEIMRLFRVGYRVSIERGFLGSYHMSADALGAKNRVLVNRIQ